MIFTAISFQDKEGKMGAGGKASRKFVEPRPSILRKTPFLIQESFTKRALAEKGRALDLEDLLVARLI